jgi:hypothetical protein
MQQKSRAPGAALRFSNAGSVRHRSRAVRELRRRTGDAMGVNMAIVMLGRRPPVNGDAMAFSA